nr:hypothetical protein [Polyangiaceae bacterium]
VGSYWDTLQWAACLKVVREICERSVACAPADAAWKYGDSDQVNRCVAAEREKYCFSVSQPHQSSDSLGWLACAAAEAPKLDCAEAFYFPFYHLSVTCGGYPNGTQPIGGLCVHNAQCSTKSCETSKTHLGCSQCIDSIAVGGDCSQGKTCASGARCVADVCVKELPENAPCTPLTACGPGLACREISGTESQCRKYARLGDPCDASLKQPCAPYFPLLSYSSTVVCEAGVCTWKPAAPFKRAVGEICDDVAIIDICGQEYAAADARCDKDSGKCVATVGEGEDCDSARPCDRGNGAAYCIQGKCKLAPVDVPNCYK